MSFYTSSLVGSQVPGSEYLTLRNLVETGDGELVARVLLSKPPTALNSTILKDLFGKTVHYGGVDVIVDLLIELKNRSVWKVYNGRSIFQELCSCGYTSRKDLPKLVRVLNRIPTSTIVEIISNVDTDYNLIHTVVCCMEEPSLFLTILSSFEGFEEALTHVDPFTGDTPLHRAVEYKQSLESLNVLLRSNNGRLALWIPNRSVETPIQLMKSNSIFSPILGTYAEILDLQSWKKSELECIIARNKELSAARGVTV